MYPTIDIHKTFKDQYHKFVKWADELENRKRIVFIIAFIPIILMVIAGVIAIVLRFSLLNSSRLARRDAVKAEIAKFTQEFRENKISHPEDYSVGEERGEVLKKFEEFHVGKVSKFKETHSVWLDNSGEGWGEESVPVFPEVKLEMMAEGMKDLFLKPGESPSQWSYVHGEVNNPVVKPFIPIKHGFLSAVLNAWNFGLPLEMAPNDLWYLFIHGLASSLANGTDAYAILSQFKRPLNASTNSVNVMETVIEEALSQAGFNENITNRLFRDFSGISNTESLTNRLILGDTFANVSTSDNWAQYFRSNRGIPKISLIGSHESYWEVGYNIDFLFDWVLSLGNYSIVWTPSFKQTQDYPKILAATEDDVDLEWWNKFVSIEAEGSHKGLGGHFKNWLWKKSLNGMNFPAVSSSKIAVQMGDSDETIRVIAGFLGVSQNRENGALRPATGWLAYKKIY